MAEQLKHFFSPDLVRRLAADLAAAEPAFPVDRFVADATSGLAALELMDRGRHIARALAAHLPPRYPDALAVLLRSLRAEHAGDENLGGGMAAFSYLPHTIFVAEHGLDDFELSMAAQAELTKRFTAEWSIRPYIARDPERAFKWLKAWSGDPHPHVRRLVSEGTRLRLPWGSRVAWLDENPERVLELLDRLKEDPSTMVRRSVANNLNDLGKVYPALLARTCEAWLAGASAERRALVEHALRSAVKRGDPEALRLLGFGGEAAVDVEEVRFEPESVAIGDKVTLRFALRSRSSTAQELLVDFAVFFVKATGRAAPKVFKLARLSLPAGGRAELRARISLAVHTTRVPRPGTHVVDVLVNGRAQRAGAFEVVAAPGG
jgi:3-methyladenine DNA glycosylase AlkC